MNRSQSKFRSTANMPSHSKLVRYDFRSSIVAGIKARWSTIFVERKKGMAPYLARQHARLLEQKKRKEDAAWERSHREQVKFSYNERFPCTCASITSSHWRFVSPFLLQLISSHSFCTDRERHDGEREPRGPDLGLHDVDGLHPCGLLLDQHADDPPLYGLPYHWRPQAQS